MPSDLEDLDKKLEQARQSKTLDEPKPSRDAENRNEGMRAGSEFLAHVFAGCFLGYAFDWFFGTLPWGLIVLCLAGFATGVYSANRALNKPQ